MDVKTQVEEDRIKLTKGTRIVAYLIFGVILSIIDLFAKLSGVSVIIGSLILGFLMYLSTGTKLNFGLKSNIQWYTSSLFVFIYYYIVSFFLGFIWNFIK